MSHYTVEQFLADSRQTFQGKGVRAGLEEVRLKVEDLLENPRLLEDYVDMEAYAGHSVIGHDAETDVYVIVHGGRKGNKSSPHDHGPCSVIYGNYTGHTTMRRWKRLDGGGSEGAAQLELVKKYDVHAGEASAFAEGDIHSIEYPDGAYFVRVTIGDVEKQKTLRYDTDRGIVEIDNRSKN